MVLSKRDGRMTVSTNQTPLKNGQQFSHITTAQKLHAITGGDTIRMGAANCYPYPMLGQRRVKK